MKKNKKQLDIVFRPSDRNNVLIEEFLNIGGKYEKDNEVVHFMEGTLLDYDWANVVEL